MKSIVRVSYERMIQKYYVRMNRTMLLTVYIKANLHPTQRTQSKSIDAAPCVLAVASFASLASINQLIIFIVLNHIIYTHTRNLTNKYKGKNHTWTFIGNTNNRE